MKLQLDVIIIPTDGTVTVGRKLGKHPAKD